MKKLWKIYDLSLIFIVVALLCSAVTLYFNRNLAIIEAVIICLFTIGKYLYFKSKKEKLMFRVRTVSSELDFSEGKAFSRLSVPCVVVEENGDIIWLNDSFRKAMVIDERSAVFNIKEIVRRDNIEKMLMGCGFRIKVENLYFSVYSSEIALDDEKIYLLYFFDETKLRLTEKEFYDTRPSVMLSVIDNADEIYQNFKESECAAIFSKVEQMIDDWATSYGALCRKFSNARMLIFVEERALQRMISDRFSILDRVRDFTYEGKNTDITLSVGVGKDDSLIEANNSARQALDMAQSRGGDQVAVKHDAQYKFFGGVSEGREKKNKVRTRLVAKSIAEIVSVSDNVIIMGHRYSDFDSFGSSVGMFTVCAHLGKKTNIVLNRDTTLAAPLVEKFIEHKGNDIVITPSAAMSLVNENTLVIVVDTHKKDFTEFPGLLDSASKVMVIDHHRKSVGYIEDTVMFFHSPNASSASEMVTEIAQYIDTKPVIDPFTALALFSGIILDTRNFILRTGVRTFEAAAYLRSRGVNTVDSKRLFSNDMEIFRHRNAIIDAAYTYKECAISLSDDDIDNVRLVTSQACDEMLNIDGVRASFVLYQCGKGVNISARSYGEINVQLIMEELGGGGHQTMSACQLADITVIEAEIKLQNAIDYYFSNK